MDHMSRHSKFFANSKVLFIPMNTANYRRSFDSATRPTSQERLFRYRKDVYDIEKEYAKRYLSTDSSLLMFIQYKEMLELYPMALKVNNLEYIKFCQSLTIENNMYDLSLPFSFIPWKSLIIKSKLPMLIVLERLYSNHFLG